MNCSRCNGTGLVRTKVGYSYKRGIACPVSALRIEYEDQWCPVCACPVEDGPVEQTNTQEAD